MSSLTDVTVSNSIIAPLKSNYVKTSNRLIGQLKYFILLQLFFGINRVYLLKYNRIVTIVCALYALGILLIISYLGFSFPNDKQITYIIIKFVTIFVNISLIILSLTTNKKKFEKVFKLLSKIDEKLNIHNDLHITSSMKGYLPCFTLVAVLSNAFLAFYVLPLKLITNEYFVIMFQIPMFFVYSVIDLEQIFIAIPLKLVYTRVIVIKAHVEKLCKKESDNDCDKKKTNLEALVANSDLNITQLHVLYKKMDKCSTVLSDAISLPLLLTILISGVHKIIFLNQVLNILQSPKIDNFAIVYAINIIFRSLKITVNVVLPCYYASQTTTEVTSMRSMLHDYLNSTDLVDKIKRRKLKAFYYLIKEFNFNYNIYGMIRLNMSLPLSYLSVCVTYFIIIIQFSKLIDNF